MLQWVTLLVFHPKKKKFSIQDQFGQFFDRIC